MALVYMGREEALEEFKEELLPHMKDASELRDLYSAEETKEYVIGAVKWAVMNGSNTALDLFAFVSSSHHKIRVVGMKGGFQCFGTAEGRSKQPVVFIDLDGMLKYKTRISKSQHNLRFPSWFNDDRGKWLIDTHYKDSARDSEHVMPDKFAGKETELSNRIATLHELGHAKQWIERPEIFVRRITKARDEIRTLAAKKAGPGAGHILKESEMPPLFTAWDPIVEMDNMDRHEWPICRELGIGYRKNYCDLGGKTGGHGAQMSELLRRAIEAKEKEDAAKQTEKPQVKEGALTGKVKCPRCGKMVRKMAVNFPCTDTRLHA